MFEKARAFEIGLGMSMGGSDIRAFLNTAQEAGIRAVTSLFGRRGLDELLRFEEMHVYIEREMARLGQRPQFTSGSSSSGNGAKSGHSQGGLPIDGEKNNENTIMSQSGGSSGTGGPVEYRTWTVVLRKYFTKVTFGEKAWCIDAPSPGEALDEAIERLGGVESWDYTGQSDDETEEAGQVVAIRVYESFPTATR